MSENNQLTGRQIAAARTLLGLGQAELAIAARISVPTLRRMESSEGEASGYANNVEAVRRALEAAGVEFIAENGGGPGVRLKKERPSEDLPSVRMHFAARLTSKERAWVHEWIGDAEDDQSAVQKVAAHLKRQMDGAPGYMLSDAVSLKGPDQSIVKEGTVADFLSALKGPHAR